jgi:hypothetical protein
MYSAARIIPPRWCGRIASTAVEEAAMIRTIGATALSAAIVLGSASAVLGTERYFEPRSYQVQTWQDIERDRQEIQRQIQIQYHLGKAGSTEAYVVPPKHHHLRKPRRDP